MLTITILFAGVLALGSMLIAALVEISERERDIATFRTLGYEPIQIARIFMIQNSIVFGAGVLLSIPFGVALVQAMVKIYENELFRMKVVVRPETVLTACAIGFGFVLIAQAVAYWLIVRLNWLAAVQARE